MANKFVTTCQLLRLLNTFSRGDHHAFLTYPQYKQLGAKGTLDLLLRRNEHYIALEMAKMLDLPRERIILHWAGAKVRRQPFQDKDSPYPFHVRSVLHLPMT